MANRIAFFSGLKGKLLLWFLVMVLVPIFVISVVSYQKAKSALQDEAFAKLSAVSE